MSEQGQGSPDSSVLTFSSEEARLEAVNKFDESTGSQNDLDRIMNAEIKTPEGDGKPAAGNGEAEHTPADQGQQATGASQQGTPAQGQGQGDAAQAASAQGAAAQKLMLEFDPTELPEGIKSKGDLLKKLKNGDETIDRQTRFIKERLDDQTVAQQIRDANTRAEAAESRLREIEAGRKQPGAQQPSPAQQGAAADARRDVSSSQSRMAEIKRQKADLEKADPMDPDTIEKRHKLEMAMIDELEYMSGAIVRANEAATNAQQQVSTVRERADQFENTRQQDEQQRKRQEALSGELKGFDDFAKKYADEFPLSKPSSQVENDYLEWGRKVATVYFGFAPAPGPQGEKQALHALAILQQKPPQLVENCKAAGVPIDPTKDIETYLKVCELADYRDGVRIDPATGKRTTAMRWNAQMGKEVPDQFPDLIAAHEYRRINDGYYRKKIVEAERKGVDQALQAAGRRDQHALDISGSGGNTQGPANRPMDQAAALKVLQETDEQQIADSFRRGDRTLLDKFNAARQVFAMEPITL